jgi:hypothetical protein
MPLFEVPQAHLQIRVRLKREQEKARQLRIVAAEIGIRRPDLAPVRVKAVLAGSLEQTDSRDIQSIAQPSFVKIESVLRDQYRGVVARERLCVAQVLLGDRAVRVRERRVVQMPACLKR